MSRLHAYARASNLIHNSSHSSLLSTIPSIVYDKVLGHCRPLLVINKLHILFDYLIGNGKWIKRRRVLGSLILFYHRKPMWMSIAIFGYQKLLWWPCLHQNHWLILNHSTKQHRHTYTNTITPVWSFLNIENSTVGFQECDHGYRNVSFYHQQWRLVRVGRQKSV